MIIDFHTHCFTDSLAFAAVKRLENNARITAKHDGTVGDLKAHLNSCGVDRGVVLPVATKPSQVKKINDWALANTNETLLFFGALNPDDPNFIETAVQLKKDGFKGIKLHPDYQHFFADEPRMMPNYEALRDLGLIVVMHAGVDIGCPGAVRCTPLMIRRIAQNVPGIKLVAAHMGSHALWRDVEEVLLGLPIFLDTSYSFYALGQDGMTRMIRRHGVERVLFGTDSPWKHADDEIKNISSLPFCASDIDRILCGNALELLG